MGTNFNAAFYRPPPIRLSELKAPSTPFFSAVTGRSQAWPGGFRLKICKETIAITDPEPEEQAMSEDSANPTEGNVPLDFLGDGTVPLEFQSLSVDADGTVTRKAPPSSFAFHFTYLEIPFSASVSEKGSKIYLNIEADFGPLPYTAEAPKLRKPMLALLDALKDEGTFRLSLNPQKRIILEGEMLVEYALTPVNIISSMTTLLVQTDPYLELIANQLVSLTPPHAANSNLDSASANGLDDQADETAKDSD